MKVKKNGEVIRCSVCGDIEAHYGAELDLPENRHLRKELESIRLEPDPKIKAEKAQRLSQELEDFKKSRGITSEHGEEHKLTDPDGDNLDDSLEKSKLNDESVCCPVDVFCCHFDVGEIQVQQTDIVLFSLSVCIKTQFVPIHFPVLDASEVGMTSRCIIFSFVLFSDLFFHLFTIDNLLFRSSLFIVFSVFVVISTEEISKYSKLTLVLLSPNNGIKNFQVHSCYRRRCLRSRHDNSL